MATIYIDCPLAMYLVLKYIVLLILVNVVQDLLRAKVLGWMIC